MPKIVKAIIPNQDEVVTRKILGEELKVFKKEFKTELMEDIQGMFFQNNTLMIESFVTKQDWARDMDQIMSTLKAIQEEQAAGFAQLSRHTNQLDNHEERINKLETAKKLVN